VVCATGAAVSLWIQIALLAVPDEQRAWPGGWQLAECWPARLASVPVSQSAGVARVQELAAERLESSRLAVALWL
jgi:hypothetical protein